MSATVTANSWESLSYLAIMMMINGTVKEQQAKISAKRVMQSIHCKFVLQRSKTVAFITRF